MVADIAPGRAGDPAVQARHVRRLHRAEGQVRGIARMVESNASCIDVLTQVSAATKALQAFSLDLLADHLVECVLDAARGDDLAGAARLAEANVAIARLVHS